MPPFLPILSSSVSALSRCCKLRATVCFWVLLGFVFPAQVFVNLYLVFNIAYNILIIFILKYGSANILWLAMTVMVPLGNLAFALPFMPQHTSITVFDLTGLIVIMTGLLGYRKGPDMWKALVGSDDDVTPQPKPSFQSVSSETKRSPLLDDFE